MPAKSVPSITADKLPVLFTLSPLACTLTFPCLISNEPVPSIGSADAATNKSPLAILIKPLLELLEVNSNSTEFIFIFIEEESGEILEFNSTPPKSIKTLPELLSLSAAIVNSAFTSL